MTDLKNRPISSKLVKNPMLEEVRAKPTIVPKEVQTRLKLDYGIDSNYYYAHKGKELAYNEVFGTHADSFSKLPTYIEALKRTNPGSHIVLETDGDEGKFLRLFVSFEAAIHGFKFIRPLICLDGTFLKEKFKGCLMAANCFDGQGELYHLAFGIVDAENDTNWRWFLQNLKIIVPADMIITFMSDRHHDIHSNIPEIFPQSYHGFCLWHLQNNLRLCLSRSGRSVHIVTLFKTVCYAPTHLDFIQSFTDFKQAADNKVNNFLSNLPFEKWANAYFPGHRYGKVSSSLSECFNSWIKNQRDLPIASLVDEIRKKVMKMRSDRRDDCKGWVNDLCPKEVEYLKDTISRSRGLTGLKAGDGLFEVYSNKTYRVNLNTRECSCNLWNIKGIPCKHVVYCMQAMGLNIHNFYQKYFFASSYRESYSHAVFPIPTDDLIESGVDVTDIVVAPDVKTAPGRPRKNRFPNTGSQKAEKKARFCSGGRQYVFHNKRTCQATNISSM